MLHAVLRSELRSAEVMLSEPLTSGLQATRKFTRLNAIGSVANEVTMTVTLKWLQKIRSALQSFVYKQTYSNQGSASTKNSSSFAIPSLLVGHVLQIFRYLSISKLSVLWQFSNWSVWQSIKIATRYREVRTSEYIQVYTSHSLQFFVNELITLPSLLPREILSKRYLDVRKFSASLCIPKLISSC